MFATFGRLPMVSPKKKSENAKTLVMVLGTADTSIIKKPHGISLLIQTEIPISSVMS